MGAEFINQTFKRVLCDMGINYYVTFSKNKAVVMNKNVEVLHIIIHTDT